MLIAVFSRRASATGTCQRHTIGADLAVADFKRAEISTLVARGIFISHDYGVLIHAFPKLSAIAIAFRIAMDLLIVS
jgi:hypothetical protein